MPSRRPRRPKAPAGPRLTGGEAAGRRLLSEPSPDLRPATALVRAACFNILGDLVVGAGAVDLFAGTGSLGLEALSRGAALVTFVERARRRARLIQANLELLGYGGRATVVTGDAILWLRRRPQELLDSRLVLMGAPYRGDGPGLCEEALRLLGTAAEVAPGWEPIVVVEHHRQLTLEERVGALNCHRTSAYGSTLLSFYGRS